LASFAPTFPAKACSRAGSFRVGAGELSFGAAEMLGLVDVTATDEVDALGTGVVERAGTGVTLSREIVSLGRLLKYHAAIPAIAIRKTTIEIGTTRDGFETVLGSDGCDAGTARTSSFGGSTTR
jgi:hypothetical protein